MSIGISNSNQNNMIMANQKIASQISEAIKALPDGEVKGTVLDVKNSIAKILTEDGQVVNGKLKFATQLNIGDIRQFIVSNDGKGTTFFSIVPESSQKLAENNIKTALMELGIKSSPENIDIAKELIKNNLPINKEQFQQISKINVFLGNNENKLSSAIFMLKNNIPITQSNANILSDFTSNSFKISNTLTQVQEQINSLPNGPLKEALLKIITTPENTNTQINQQAKGTALENTNAQGHAPNTTDTENPIDKNAPLQKATTDNLGTIAEKMTTNQKGEIPPDGKPLQNLENKLNTLDKQSISLDKTLDKLPLETNTEFKEILSEKKLDTNLDLKWLDKFDLSKSTLEDLDEYSKDINQKIENLIKELQKHDTPESKTILENLTNAKDRLLFANNLKDNFYVQIPINLNKNETVELMVYKDKNNKSSKKNGTSAIIGLDTANLGRFETFLEKEDSNLNFQFKLENKDIINLVKANINKLESLLNEKNLSIRSISYSEIDNKFNITTENSFNENTINSFKLNIKM